MSETPHTNNLEHSASSYLRSARHQPVDWHPWGAEAFRLAQEQNKPILLDIGAVWCHWCHVMDRESYENPTIAALINEYYIAIKVDRDERPDVDTRYQAAIASISGQGGWPLTAILTPDGRPYFGGTYFPPEDRYGRPGFARVLLMMGHVWIEQREQALESAASIMSAIEQNESFSGRGGELTFALSEKLAESALKQFDERHGGFGSQPKFPHSAALDLLLTVSARTGNKDYSNAVLTTLRKMAAGGIYDQLAGGFHRYSVDERWVVPHFEKMLYDNTELLRNYVHAYQISKEESFADIARDILRWLNEWMTDQKQGGFYASQDADINLDDDGDYFTWTLDEVRALLTDDELKIASEWWDIGPLGDMHHNPQKNVLHCKLSLEELAKQTARTPESTRELIASAHKKLLAGRLARPTPFIDRTLYTSWNAMAISAYLESAQALQIESAKQFALKTLDRLLGEAFDQEGNLARVIAYTDGLKVAERVAGTLDDYAFTTHATLSAWEATGAIEYYNAAIQLADAMIDRFFDRTSGAFFDTEQSDNPLGVLSARRKPIQDSPTPAGNSVAASALLRLEHLSGNSEYRNIAEDILDTFAGIVEHFGLYVGSYGLALERLLTSQSQVVIVGEGEAEGSLTALAASHFGMTQSIIRLKPSQLLAEHLPAALAETILQVPVPSGHSWALVCKGRTCLPPITSAEDMQKALQ